MQKIRTLRSLHQKRVRNYKDQRDRYLCKIFWMIFLTNGASGSRQTSLWFFRVALQKGKEDETIGHRG